MSLDSCEFEDAIHYRNWTVYEFKSVLIKHPDLISNSNSIRIEILIGEWELVFRKEPYSDPEDHLLDIKDYTHVSLQILKDCEPIPFSDFEKGFPKLSQKLSKHRMYTTLSFFMRVPIDLVEEFLVSVKYNNSSSKPASRRCCVCGDVEEYAEPDKEGKVCCYKHCSF